MCFKIVVDLSIGRLSYLKDTESKEKNKVNMESLLTLPSSSSPSFVERNEKINEDTHIYSTEKCDNILICCISSNYLSWASCTNKGLSHSLSLSCITVACKITPIFVISGRKIIDLSWLKLHIFDDQDFVCGWNGKQWTKIDINSNRIVQQSMNIPKLKTMLLCGGWNTARKLCIKLYNLKCSFVILM